MLLCRRKTSALSLDDRWLQHPHPPRQWLGSSGGYWKMDGWMNGYLYYSNSTMPSTQARYIFNTFLNNKKKVGHQGIKGILSPRSVCFRSSVSRFSLSEKKERLGGRRQEPNRERKRRVGEKRLEHSEVSATPERRWVIGNAKDFSSLFHGFMFTITTLSTFELCVKRE